MDSDTTISTLALSDSIFEALPPSAQDYIRFLESTIRSLESNVRQLQGQIRDLESRLSKNSSNSSKPPSSDGFRKKTKSQRGKSGKRPGAQPGHTGRGLAQAKNPHVIVTHAPECCHGCGACLRDVNGRCAEKRQVIDVPQPKVEITEHRVEEKECPCCGALNRAAFPDAVRGPVQYGDRVQALIAYFAHQHFIPVDRVCQVFEDIFHIDISPGTCSSVDEKLYQRLESFESGLKAYLLSARVLHFDETGMRCEKKLHWVHVASSQMATLYMMHSRRGREAMDEMGVLSQFEGIAVHDHWFPYFSYNGVVHSLCNAHHLRELEFVEEQEKENWAKRMKSLLLRARGEVEKHAREGKLPVDTLLEIELEYTQIITEGIEYHSRLSPMSHGKRGRQKQRVGKNLLDRLRMKRDCVLRFMRDFSVPFTNNQGEQDIRMVKLKQKIAGCFRTPMGGRIFCRIRSYISTARKQGWNIWDALAEAMRGIPRLLSSDRKFLEQAVAA
jgi:transposase